MTLPRWEAVRPNYCPTSPAALIARWVQSSDGRADILAGSGGERWEADGEGVEKTTATAA